MENGNRRGRIKVTGKNKAVDDDDKDPGKNVRQPTGEEIMEQHRQRN